MYSSVSSHYCPSALSFPPCSVTSLSILYPPTTTITSILPTHPVTSQALCCLVSPPCYLFLYHHHSISSSLPIRGCLLPTLSAVVSSPPLGEELVGVLCFSYVLQPCMKMEFSSLPLETPASRKEAARFPLTPLLEECLVVPPLSY